MQLEIQKWCNSAAIRLSKTLLRQIETSVGEKVDVEVKDGELVLRPVHAEIQYNLDQLLSTCTKARITLDKEDRTWLDESPIGKEF